MLTLIQPRKYVRRYLSLAGVIILCLLAADGVVLALKWPFTLEKVIVSLERVSSSKVRIGGFHKTFFPSPGYVAEDVGFARDSSGNATQLASVHFIRCRAKWSELITLTHRVNELRLEGLRVWIPAYVPPPVRLHPAAVIESTVTELIADGAMLEIAPRHGAGQTLRFEFPKLRIGNVAKKKAMTFRMVLHNPDPPGDLSVTGTLGPFQTGRPSEIPLSGSYSLADANLSPYKVIGGLLSSNGSFKGTLGHAEVDGRAAISNFEVTRSHHELGLSAEFLARVDGVHGDVWIQDVNAHFLHTNVRGHGSITGQQGKSLLLDLTAQQARIEDLLWLFVKADRSPLRGRMTFRTRVTLPSGHEKFLRRVRLNGDFTIRSAQFSHANTQEKVDDLSKRARSNKGKDHGRSEVQEVLSDVNGHANLRDAQAFLSNTTFGIPGALARGEGTFNLITQRIDFHGTLAMEASLSKAAGGIKSILLIPLDPFFRRQHVGAVLPVRMTGTYSHPLFKVSLTGKK